MILSEQIDVMVDLDVLPLPLPDIEFLRDFVDNVPNPPPKILEGILRQGCKMILGPLCSESWNSRIFSNSIAGDKTSSGR